MSIRSNGCATPDPAAETHSPILSRARTLHHAQARDEAEALYRLALTEHPDDPAALYWFGVFSAEAGRLDQAQALFTTLVQSQPDHIDGRLALADVAARAGLRTFAAEQYRAVLAMTPTYPLAIIKLASAVLEGDWGVAADVEAAIDVCRAAITLLPAPAPAHALLGRLLLVAERPLEAIEAYKAALIATPGEVALWTGISQALLLTGDAGPALEAADVAGALDPRSPDAWHARGSAFLALGQPQEALNAFKQGFALAPDQTRMPLGLGAACAELDRNGEALAHFQRAVALDPASKAAQANAGAMFHWLGDLDQAERHCLQALALDADLVAAHQNLAGVYADRGMENLSRRHRDHAFKLRNVRVETAAAPAARVLVLTTSGSGNIPYRYLLPKSRFTRIEWFIDYAEEGQAAALPTYDLAFNVIGDSDHAQATDDAVAAFVERCGHPVLNTPARIGPTRRDRIESLLGDLAGVSIPKTLRLEPDNVARGDLSALLARRDLKRPMLIRPVGMHGGQGLSLISTPQDLEGLDPAGSFYVTEFVDYRSDHDGRYRKYRAIFVDRRPFPYHLAIKDSWLVHYFSAEMSNDASRQAEELRYLSAPEETLGEIAWNALASIGRRLDLDFAGIDFSLLADGRILVFESNATMLVHPEPEGEFAYKNPFVAAITDSFQTLVERKACPSRRS